MSKVGYRKWLRLKVRLLNWDDKVQREAKENILHVSIWSDFIFSGAHIKGSSVIVYTEVRERLGIFLILLCFWGSSPLRSTDWLWRCNDPPASASRLLELQALTTMPSLFLHLSLITLFHRSIIESRIHEFIFDLII